MFQILKNKLVTLAFVLLIIGAIVPILNGIRIFFFQLPIGRDNYWLYFLSKNGPWNLMLTGMIGFLNTIYFLRKRIKLAWWFHFFGVFWVGGGDSLSAYIFLSKTGLPKFPIVLPIIVTSINFLGLFLIYKYINDLQNEV